MEVVDVVLLLLPPAEALPLPEFVCDDDTGGGGGG